MMRFDLPFGAALAGTVVAASLLAPAPSAQEPRARVRSAELALERLDVESDGVPWTFVEVRYPRSAWTEETARSWDQPGGLLWLGDGLARAELSTGSWVDCGESGFDTSEDGELPATLGIRFRAEDDPSDEPPLWLEVFSSTDADGAEGEEIWGSAVEVEHSLLAEPSPRLAVRLVAAPREAPKGTGDAHDEGRRYPARLEIRWGPHLLRCALLIELPTPIPSRSGTRLDPAVRTAIERAKHVEFLAIDPLEERVAVERFRGFDVFATSRSTDPALRRTLASGLRRAALLGPPWSVDCFEPELGLRIRDPELGDYDVLLSASCTSMVVWRLGEDEATGPRLDQRLTRELVRRIDRAAGFVRRDG